MLMLMKNVETVYIARHPKTERRAWSGWSFDAMKSESRDLQKRVNGAKCAASLTRDCCDWFTIKICWKVVHKKKFCKHSTRKTGAAEFNMKFLQVQTFDEDGMIISRSNWWVAVQSCGTSEATWTSNERRWSIDQHLAWLFIPSSKL